VNSEMYHSLLLNTVLISPDIPIPKTPVLPGFQIAALCATMGDCPIKDNSSFIRKKQRFKIYYAVIIRRN